MTTVQMYHDMGDGHPAVNIKIRSIRRDMERLLPLSEGGDDHTTPPEFTLKWIDQNMEEGHQSESWTIACEQGFEHAEEIAKELFGANVKVYQEGRSGGWLVVHGLGDVESWGPEDLEAWNTFGIRVQAIAQDTPRRWLEMVYFNVFMYFNMFTRDATPSYQQQEIDGLTPVTKADDFYRLKITANHDGSSTKYLNITAAQLAAIRKILA